jgi:hypothetical protein
VGINLDGGHFRGLDDDLNERLAGLKRQTSQVLSARFPGCIDPEAEIA